MISELVNGVINIHRVSGKFNLGEKQIQKKPHSFLIFFLSYLSLVVFVNKEYKVAKGINSNVKSEVRCILTKEEDSELSWDGDQTGPWMSLDSDIWKNVKEIPGL